MNASRTAVITGVHLAEAVLKHGRGGLAEIVVLRGGSARGLARVVELAGETGVPVRWVDADAMRELTGESSVQVAAALTEREPLDISDLVTDDPAPLLILAIEGVEDPHNLGMILRTALAAGANPVVLEKHARGMPRDVLARSSAAASECLQLAFADDLARTLDALHARGVTTVAAATAGGENLFETKLPGRMALVVGGERRGLSKHVLGKCRMRLTIPMAPEVQSLSAVAGAAVMLFETVRQRGALPRQSAEI